MFTLSDVPARGWPTLAVVLLVALAVELPLAPMKLRMSWVSSLLDDTRMNASGRMQLSKPLIVLGQKNEGENSA